MDDLRRACAAVAARARSVAIDTAAIPAYAAGLPPPRTPPHSADGSAVALATHLGRRRCFADTSRYDGLTLPFLKRAQIAAADLARAGVSEFGDLEELTMFADNLVPHVLRLDAILEFDPDLR